MCELQSGSEVSEIYTAKTNFPESLSSQCYSNYKSVLTHLEESLLHAFNYKLYFTFLQVKVSLLSS